MEKLINYFSVLLILICWIHVIRGQVYQANYEFFYPRDKFEYAQVANRFGADDPFPQKPVVKAAQPQIINKHVVNITFQSEYIQYQSVPQRGLNDPNPPSTTTSQTPFINNDGNFNGNRNQVKPSEEDVYNSHRLPQIPAFVNSNTQAPATQPPYVADREENLPFINHRGLTPENLKFISTFSWKLFAKSKLPNPESNFILSPISVQLLLSILDQGSAGETKRQFTEVLGGSGDPQQIAQAAQSLRPERSTNEIEIATAIFPSITYKLNDTFLENAGRLGVKVAPVSFEDVYRTAELINSWASQATNNQIREIVEPNAQLAGLKFLLSNAIYFRGLWKSPFNATERGVFQPNPYSNQDVTYLTKVIKLTYGERTLRNGVVYRWIELPYVDNEYSMLIVLPKMRHRLQDVISNMSEEEFHELTNGVERSYKKNVHLKLPKFEVNSRFSLVNTLIKMGLTDPFTQLARFPYLTQSKNFKIDDAIQHAVLKVDEKGSTASAVTTFSVIALSSGIYTVEDIDFHIDEPFLSIIVDKKQVLPIFISKIYQP